jgi:hypothetical protein
LPSNPRALIAKLKSLIAKLKSLIAKLKSWSRPARGEPVASILFFY